MIVFLTTFLEVNEASPEPGRRGGGGRKSGGSGGSGSIFGGQNQSFYSIEYFRFIACKSTPFLLSEFY